MRHPRRNGPARTSRFCGPPDRALAHFGVETFDAIYEAVDRETRDETANRGGVGGGSPTGRRQLPGLAGRSFFGQAAALTGRYAHTLTRDRRSLAILLGQVPIIALLISSLFPTGLLVRPDMNPSSSAQFVFLLITAALWLGLISSCREIVKERSILFRELAVGVRLDAYLFAKVVVLFALVAVQVVILTAISLALQPLHEPFIKSVELCGLLVLTGWVSATMGSAVSSLARNPDQATSAIPLLLIPQLLLAGAFVPVHSMGRATQGLSDVVFSRWAYAGSGNLLDLTSRLGEDPDKQPLNPFGDQFFRLAPGSSAVVLIGFAAVFLLGTALLVSRQVARGEG